MSRTLNAKTLVLHQNGCPKKLIEWEIQGDEEEGKIHYIGVQLPIMSGMDILKDIVNVNLDLLKEVYYVTLVGNKGGKKNEEAFNWL